MERTMQKALGFLALFLSWVALPLAAAADLDELRKSGVVGERWDGLAVVREEDAGADVASTVKSINEKRRSIYAERAKAQGVASAEVGKVYALEILEKAPAGTWFLDAAGKWVKK